MVKRLFIINRTDSYTSTVQEGSPFPPRINKEMKMLHKRIDRKKSQNIEIFKFKSIFRQPSFFTYAATTVNTAQDTGRNNFKNE